MEPKLNLRTLLYRLIVLSPWRLARLWCLSLWDRVKKARLSILERPGWIKTRHCVVEFANDPRNRLKVQWMIVYALEFERVSPLSLDHRHLVWHPRRFHHEDGRLFHLEKTLCEVFRVLWLACCCFLEGQDLINLAHLYKIKVRCQSMSTPLLICS